MSRFFLDHGAGTLGVLAQRELNRVALDLVTRQHHKVWPRLIKGGAEKRHRIVTHMRGLLDVRELQHAEAPLGVKAQRPRGLIFIVNHSFLLMRD